MTKKIIVILYFIGISCNGFTQIYASIESLNINTIAAEYLPKIENDSTLLFLRKTFVSKTNIRTSPWNYFPYTTSVVRYNYKVKKEIDTLLVKERVFMDYIFTDSLEYFVEYYIQDQGYELKRVLDLTNNRRRIKIETPSYSTNNTVSIFKENQTIYFSTDYAYENKGGEDIYWIKNEISHPIPKNLAVINSACDESYFFKDAKGNYFFSRKCKDNWDIYKYDIQSKKELKLPYPINTAYDDFGYFSKNNDIFITSNRKHGKGEFDIYHIKVENTK